MKSERVPIKEAAELLGTSPAAVRERMRRGIYDIGLYIPKSKSGNSRDSFEIYRAKLNKLLCIE